jgi:hypothetical protein
MTPAVKLIELEDRPALPQEAAAFATVDVLDGQGWPEPLAPEAMHGLAGEIMQAIEPDTESDPAAMLLQILVAFGALVARGPHVRVEGDEHHTNLFALVVGDTSKGRKGTSWGRVRQVFGRIQSWKPTVSGLSSGEGLKFNVRDPVQKPGKNALGEMALQTSACLSSSPNSPRLYVSRHAPVIRCRRRCARLGIPAGWQR